MVEMTKEQIAPTILLFAGLVGFVFGAAPVAVYLAMIVLFTAFDIFGFRFIAGKNREVVTNDTQGFIDRSLPAYRILQVAFQILISVVAWQRFGWTVPVAFLVSWELLTCDVLFYYAIGIKLNDFSWWDWSPVVFFEKQIEKKTAAPAWLVLVSGIVGLLMGLSIVIFI